MGEWDGNMGNDRRTRRTGRRKEEGAMNSLFCPQLEDHIARIQCHTKVWEACDDEGMKEKIPRDRGSSEL